MLYRLRTLDTRLRSSVWLLVGAACVIPATARVQDPIPAVFYVVAVTDPARDPAEDLAVAVQRATAEHKRILLQVGGEWCSWCHILDRYIAEHQQVADLLERGFLIVKVNFSQENQNTAFLRDYPTIPGYPHIFVLESDGKLLHSQNTELLESGRSYDLDAMLEFLRTWAPEDRPAS